jgi:DNA invertase Pin-like site-specific DNA recombinase
MTETEGQVLRLLLVARLSRKVGKYQGIGIETQDQYGREWAERQHDFTTVHGTYRNVEVIDTAPDTKSGRVAPWDRKNLKPWVTRPELIARYDGILAYKNDRLSRGAPEDEWRIRQWASEKGKVLIIVDGPQWPPRHDGDFWQWTALAKAAEDEWNEIQERNVRQQRELRSRGKLVGRCPWGFVPSGEKYDKTIVATDEGRKYVPQIFQRKADGDSLMMIARWLDSQDAEPKYGGSWSPKSIANIIRNRTYMGQHLDRSGRLLLTVDPPLVDAKLWQRANDSLTNAPRGRRGPVTGKTALLTGCLFCPRCPKAGKDAPMYRVYSRGRGHYYRCAGHLPQRKGCGNMVHLEATDTMVISLLSMAPEPWTEPRMIPGENYDIPLAEIRLQLDDLPRRNLSDVEEDAERKRLRAERDRLEEANKRARPDRWEDVSICDTCGGSQYTDDCEASGHRKVTVGQHFRSLAADSRRTMLLDDVKVYAERPLDPRILQVTAGPIITIESRLFKLPITWLDETDDSEAGASSSVVAIRPKARRQPNAR